MSDLTKKEIEITLDDEIVKNIKTIAMFHKIFGILGIIFGGIYTITIIGAIAGIPFIMIALNFLKAGEFLKSALETKDKEALGNYFIHQKKSMKIYFIYIIIMIASSIIIPIILTIFGAIIAVIMGNSGM